MTKPKPYDMKKKADLIRWFREMEGYMSIANEGNGFVTDGTDKKGRKFALKGFHQLKSILIETESVNGITLFLKDNLLVHLFENQGSYQDGKAGIQLTQEGMAIALKIHQPQVARAVKTLLKNHLIKESPAYVAGATRQRKIYIPTKKGITEATKLKGLKTKGGK